MASGRRLLVGFTLVVALGAGSAIVALRPILASAAPEPVPALGRPPAAVPAGALAWRVGAALRAPVDVPRPSAAPEKTEPQSEPRYLTARVRTGAGVTLRFRPGGPPIRRIDATTEFGSPATLGVVERRGAWLGVVSPELANGEVAWIRDDRKALDIGSTPMSVRIDLSRRTLVLLRGNEVVRRVRVGIGRPGSPTPTGRFAVTDKLSGAPYGGVYGCCVLALSGRQSNLPSGWTGGDRLAVHGTDEPSSIGVPSSAGCLRAADRDLRSLMRRLPLGAPVFIRA